MELISYFYQILIFFYSILITVIYISLAVLGYFKIIGKKTLYTRKEEDLIKLATDYAPGISVIAPAFNEEVIIIDNVKSFLNLEYPNFEVIIVNDGSKDNTLKLLIEEFHLKEIDFHYVEKIKCQPVSKVYKSVYSQFNKLTVVDKINGGTKADAMNAGVNVAKYDYFINTDVDCILAKDTLTKVILPVLDASHDETIIAVGATMRMSNGCEVVNGEMINVNPPKNPIPTFQETEYLRSYLVAKMGWSSINSIPNVSGGFGLFNKEIVINSGGYDPRSHAEDMDMTFRMIAYMYDHQLKYKIIQIPDTCCWTEGPLNLKVLNRQRTRWGRGLLQIFRVHKKFLFNPKYKKLGFIIMPYTLIFEFLAPIIEIVGLLFLIFLLLSNQINYETFWLMLFFVYLIGITVSLITIAYDLSVKKIYSNHRYYGRLILYSLFEAIFYHPFVVIFTIRGYWQYLTKKKFKWGTMTRQGYKREPVKRRSYFTKSQVKK